MNDPVLGKSETNIHLGVEWHYETGSEFPRRLCDPLPLTTLLRLKKNQKIMHSLGVEPGPTRPPDLAKFKLRTYNNLLLNSYRVRAKNLIVLV